MSAPDMKKPAPATRALPPWLGELHLVRRALLCFAGTLIISLVLLGVTGSYRQQQAKQLEQAQRSRTAAASLFNQVETEKQEIRTYGPRFEALRQRGLIGEENRLAWIDAMQRSQARRKLLPLSYEISAQQALKVPLAFSTGQYQLHASKMQLHMDLLHEGDLFDFLNDLRRAGYIAVQDCAIRRSSGGDEGNGGIANNAAAAPMLSTDCSLLWLTLGQAPAAVGGLP